MAASVTIILPVFNGEKFLREAIESVLTQTYSDFELWIINDGSTDSTTAIIDSFTDPRIKRIDNESNIGLVATLNRAFPLVQSPFIARMDCDDLWEKTKIEKQLRILDSRPDVGICGTSVQKFGAIDSTLFFPVESEALKVGLLFYCMMSHPSVIYRTSFLRKSKLIYRTEYYPAEDYKMWVDALQFTNIYNIPEPLVHYRQHEGQICREKEDAQHILDRIIQEEQLRRIYPFPTNEELLFHLDSFVSLMPKSDIEVLHYKQWGKTLLKANKHSRYIKPIVFKKELKRYIQNGVRAFYKKTWKGVLQHVVSGRIWMLDFRRNLSLLKNGYHS